MDTGSIAQPAHVPAARLDGFTFCDHCAPQVPPLLAAVATHGLSAVENRPRRPVTPQQPPGELGQAWRIVTQMWRLAHTDTVSATKDNRAQRTLSVGRWAKLVSYLREYEEDFDLTARPRQRRGRLTREAVVSLVKGED